MKFTQVTNQDISINVAIEGSGPLIVCVHGWPELWYSWRHQLEYFSQRGYTVAALDVRGYGKSSKPDDVASYSLKELTSDVAAVVRSLSDDGAILIGHDWGAPIVWNTALLYPNLIRAVAGLSVPYIPGSDRAFIDVASELYADQFFYQIYFQEKGKAESELETDIPTALRKIYYAISGDAPSDDWLKHKPKEASLLDGMIDPNPFPEWLTSDDLHIYSQAFEAGGFTGPLNRYRAQRIDVDELTAIRGKKIEQPAYFIGGAKDAVRHFVSGLDMYANPGIACLDFRGSTIIENAGHWVQQEAPRETNEALDSFLKSL
tara:strand:+ start:374 stop:1327 length:954 start_codon:yes stop_codon:yes gene_type:complete